MVKNLSTCLNWGITYSVIRNLPRVATSYIKGSEVKSFWDRVLDITFLMLNPRTKEEWFNDLRAEAHRETGPGPSAESSRDVPVDELVHQYKPEAVYKVLPDARRKLKTGLQDRGLGIGETQTCLARLGKILGDCETNRCKVKFQSGH